MRRNNVRRSEPLESRVLFTVYVGATVGEVSARFETEWADVTATSNFVTAELRDAQTGIIVDSGSALIRSDGHVSEVLRFPEKPGTLALTLFDSKTAAVLDEQIIDVIAAPVSASVAQDHPISTEAILQVTGPQITFSRELEPGRLTTVRFANFPASADLDIVFEQGGHLWNLGSGSTSSRGTGSEGIQVPDDVLSGTAQVIVYHSGQEIVRQPVTIAAHEVSAHGFRPAVGGPGPVTVLTPYLTTNHVDAYDLTLLQDGSKSVAVRAAHDGRVVEVSAHKSPSTTPYGNKVVVEYDNGRAQLFAHLSSFHVVPNQRVSAGQSVGLQGSTGRSTGPHLHTEFGQWLNGRFVNDRSPANTRPLIDAYIMSIRTGNFASDKPQSPSVAASPKPSPTNPSEHRPDRAPESSPPSSPASPPKPASKSAAENLLPKVNQALREAGSPVNDRISKYWQERVVNGDKTTYEALVGAIRWNIQNKRGPYA